jgi:hypothetical protein
MLSDFLSNYAITLASEGEERLSEYVNEVFGSSLIKGAKSRSLATFFSSVANALKSISAASLPSGTLEQNTVRGTVRTMIAEFSSGGAPKALQDALKHDLALALQHTRPWVNPDVALVLQILALYPAEKQSIKANSLPQKSRVALASWLGNLGNGTWSQNASSACSSAFVMGELMSFADIDWISGVNSAEREMGMALCTLASLTGKASETLWPAIFKGLQTASPVVELSTSFYRTNRSMILLEFGCRECVISGMGNGDLIADQNQSLLPPPPNIEGILHNAAVFIIEQLTILSTNLVTNEGKTASGANRCSEANAVSTLVASLIDQLTVLHAAYPSSISIPLVANKTLQKVSESTASKATNVHMVETQILLYAALSCGAEFSDDPSTDITRTCRSVLGIDFSSIFNGPTARRDTKQALRSVFHYTKW